MSRTASTPGLAGHFAGFLPSLCLPGRWRRLRTLSPLPPARPAMRTIRRFYDSSDLFDRAIDKVADYPPSNVRLTGITVPHHLLADRLVALGFRAASGQSYKRIVILTPDHFRKTDKPFATTRRGFETVKGKVATDAVAVSRLLQAGDWIEESCLFDKDHGIRAMLPFVKHYFPEATVRAGGHLDPRRPCRLGQNGGRAGAAGRQRHAGRRIDRLLALSAAARGAPLRPADAEHPGFRIARRHRRAAAAAARRFCRRALHPDEAAESSCSRRLPLVIANENSQRYSPDYVQETTSYNVILFGTFGPDYNDPPLDNVRTYYFAGDVEFRPLDEEGAARRRGWRSHRAGDPRPHQVAAADRQPRRRHPAQRPRSDRRHDARHAAGAGDCLAEAAQRRRRRPRQQPCDGSRRFGLCRNHHGARPPPASHGSARATCWRCRASISSA